MRISVINPSVHQTNTFMQTKTKTIYKNAKTNKYQNNQSIPSPLQALDDPTTEAGSDSSSPEGQRLQSEILSLQQEARLKKQQLAEVAASVDQVRGREREIIFRMCGKVFIITFPHLFSCLCEKVLLLTPPFLFPNFLLTPFFPNFFLLLCLEDSRCRRKYKCRVIFEYQ